jgi:hypothetical protein
MPLPRPTTLTVTNLTLTTANTGYSWTPAGSVIGFSIQARTAVDVKVGATQASVESGGSSFATIKSGSVMNSPQDFGSKGTAVLWFSAGSSSIVLEIVSWAN